MSMTETATLDPRFQHPQYLVRKKIFKFLGDAFHIYDPQGNVVFYSRLKAFKLKEDIRLWTGEDMQTEVLRIQARRILDIAATYDVYDSQQGVKVGALRRKGLKSIIKDEWNFLDVNDEVMGTIAEDVLVLALIRRFVTPLIPQSYDGFIGETQVCDFSQNFNPFVTKVTLDFTPDTQGLLDRRLGIAAAVLLCGIEGKQG
jgi:uncharacterized protein YxjI